MKNISFENARLTSGYLFDKQELNRKTTINAVYDRFYETGRITAFDFDYDEAIHGKDKKPHIFWDSDVAKWMESAAYILKKHDAPVLMEKVEALIDKIEANQCEDGYFNIYFTVIEPNARFTDRSKHELYCAGHLIEAAVAYAEATGRERFLRLMEKYADYIKAVFMDKVEGACRPKFETPGHQEIEMALIRLYIYTKKQKYLDLAKHFLDVRGTEKDVLRDSYNQSHIPVREQTEAVGHSVRAMYQYTGMAMLARETGDAELIKACKALWDDTVLRKMYVTGGIGSTRIGEAFTVPFDLPSDQAYTETCAGIGLIFFANAMLELENNAKYADVIERVLYNGVLSGLSLDGQEFFYENPLEINLADRFSSSYGHRVFPITQRVRCFDCSCCPPNITRLLATLEKYAYGVDGDTLYVNQFVSSTLELGEIKCTQSTAYPNDGSVIIKASGARRIAIRIPEWCDNFSVNKPYKKSNGYAVVENDGGEIKVNIELSPRAVYADCRVKNDANRVCVMRGPMVYCAEGVDNSDNLHTYVISTKISAKESFSKELGLYTLDVDCKKRVGFDGTLYSNKPPKSEKATLKMIPYSCFANRGESDMIVWLCGEYN